PPWLVLGDRRAADRRPTDEAAAARPPRGGRRRRLRRGRGALMETRRQGLPLISAITILIATLVIIQLWILAATIDGLLGGDRGIAGPAAIVQVVLAALNGGLLLHVVAFDRRLRRLRRERDG